MFSFFFWAEEEEEKKSKNKESQNAKTQITILARIFIQNSLISESLTLKNDCQSDNKAYFCAPIYIAS